MRRMVLWEIRSYPEALRREWTMNRWVRLWSAFVGMVMIGNLQYAWTLFAQPMVKAHAQQHWQLSDVQWGFGLFIAAGTWTMPFVASFIDNDRSPHLDGPFGAALRRRLGIAGARRKPDLVLSPLLPWRELASRACTHAESRSR